MLLRTISLNGKGGAIRTSSEIQRLPRATPVSLTPYCSTTKSLDGLHATSWCPKSQKGTSEVALPVSIWSSMVSQRYIQIYWSPAYWSYTQKLASEAIDLYFPSSSSHIAIDKAGILGPGDRGSRSQLVRWIKTWAKWKKVEWLNSVKDVRENLMLLIAPNIMERYAGESFKLTGKR